MDKRWILLDGEDVNKRVRNIALNAIHEIMNPPVQCPEDEPISRKYHMCLGVMALVDKIEYTIEKDTKEFEEEQARERKAREREANGTAADG